MLRMSTGNEQMRAALQAGENLARPSVNDPHDDIDIARRSIRPASSASSASSVHCASACRPFRLRSP